MPIQRRQFICSCEHSVFLDNVCSKIHCNVTHIVAKLLLRFFSSKRLGQDKKRPRVRVSLPMRAFLIIQYSFEKKFYVYKSRKISFLTSHCCVSYRANISREKPSNNKFKQLITTSLSVIWYPIWRASVIHSISSSYRSKCSPVYPLFARGEWRVTKGDAKGHTLTRWTADRGSTRLLSSWNGSELAHADRKWRYREDRRHEIPRSRLACRISNSLLALFELHRSHCNLNDCIRDGIT